MPDWLIPIPLRIRPRITYSFGEPLVKAWSPDFVVYHRFPYEVLEFESILFATINDTF